MKKSLLLILVCISCTMAANAKRIQLDLRTANANIENVAQYLDSLSIVSDVEYKIYRDVVNGNIRHVAFHQYYQNILVENCDIIVHSKNGFITSITGDLIDVNIDNNAKISKRNAKKNAGVNDSTDIEQTIIYHKNSFVPVYKITKPCEILYIDINSNEVIERIPLLVNSVYNCSITTKYAKTTSQHIDCDKVDDKYYLENSSKDINTYAIDLTDYFAKKGGGTNLVEFSNNSTNWNNSYLTSVTITECNNAWWDGLLETDDYPDLYITIENANGTILYYSDFKYDVQQLPVTFYVADMIKVPSGGGYKIKIYDKDFGGLLDGDDDLGTTVSLNNNAIKTYSWGTSKSSDVVGKLTISNWHPALDVQWGLENVYNFYKNTLNINSFDDNNASVQAFFHNVSKTSNISIEKEEYNNAFAAGAPGDPSTALLYFGLGNEKFNSEVGYNTICHEFTHLVTRYRPLGDLVYHGEPGAINEGYSDAMAMTAEYYLLGHTDWKYDKECIVSGPYDCVRDLAHPEAGGVEGYIKPTTYHGANWLDPTDLKTDSGGVHVNNSIFTFWYYLLCEGGSGKNSHGFSYNVTGLGIPKGLEIIWNLHRNYVDPKSTFPQLRFNALDFAIDMYGVNSQEYKSIEAAWDAVGVYDSSPILDGKYIIYAGTDTCSWFLSSTLTNTSTKRFFADTINAYKDYFYVNPDPNYVWEITRNTNGTYYLKGENGYMSWNSGNSGAISSTPKEFSISAEDDYAMSINFMPSVTETRYLSLNNNSSYFAFYNNQGQNYKLYFLEAVFADTITIKAKMPSNWGSAIRAWVWNDGENGSWETPTKEGDWYVYKGVIYDDSPKFNIIFVNGSNWSTDNNQTIDISVSQDMCIQIGSNSGKRTYTNIDCEDKPAANSYYLLARRKTGDYYYLTPTTVSGKERLIAIDAGDSVRSRIDTINAPTSYLWTLENATDGVKLKGSTNTYLYSSAAKSAKMDATGFVLKQRSNSDGTYTFYYPKSSTENWYLSLATAGNDYFVFYANENQFTHFLLMKRGSSTPTSIIEIATPQQAKKIVVDGTLYIILDGNKYNISGQLIK